MRQGQGRPQRTHGVMLSAVVTQTAMVAVVNGIENNLHQSAVFKPMLLAYMTCTVTYANGPDCINDNCGRRVMRGGSWFYDTYGVSSTYRSGDSTDARDFDDGFRVARTLP